MVVCDGELRAKGFSKLETPSRVSHLRSLDKKEREKKKVKK